MIISKINFLPIVMSEHVCIYVHKLHWCYCLRTKFFAKNVILKQLFFGESIDLWSSLLKVMKARPKYKGYPISVSEWTHLKLGFIWNLIIIFYMVFAIANKIAKLAAMKSFEAIDSFKVIFYVFLIFSGIYER